MPDSTRTRAAQYIRMSTDAQELSPEIQKKAIEAYAHGHGINVVETYFDAGRSGLTLHKRPAMKKLLNDVADEQCPFSIVLVYDISRWGRFQDTDASAYYEYHCRLNGVDVKYVQEPFDGADTPLGSVIKGLKRAMAAEYSRELAVKTRAGQGAALDRGFHMGSLPCIGIGRVAVSNHGDAQRELAPTEHKATHREHVKWIPGPADEVHLVQRIFHLYTTTDISIVELANVLRRENRTARNGKRFSPWMLYSMLACEAFIGNFVWGREDQGYKRDDDDEKFRRIPGSIEPIVSREVWDAAKAKRSKRAGVIRTRDELLADLQALVKQNPQLNASQLQFYNCASRSTYVKFFGSFESALGLLGLVPSKRDEDAYSQIVKVCALGGRLCNAVESVLTRQGVQCTRLRPGGGHSILVNGESKVRIQVIKRRARYGVIQWSLRKIYRETFDHVLIVRVNADESVFDSILLQRDQYFSYKLWFDDELPGSYERLETDTDVGSKFRTLAPFRTAD
jgi:DNA invertase Pin-like site-specific DNA recombinase